MRTKIGAFGLVVAGLVIGSLVASGIVRADDAPVKKHHHHHHIHGKIVSVDASSITIKVHHHHKKGSTTVAAASETKTFQISASTKVEIVGKDHTKVAGSVADLKTGEHVSIGEHEGVAHEISIIHHHHHKKPAPVPA